VGNVELPIAIKEITDEAEFDAYRSLTRYHYRGKSLHGRTARLIVRAFHPSFPQVIGYVELTTPFYMNKARSQIIDAPFQCDGIAWDHWGKAEQRKYIHLFVRIARCVVYPEFRGLGLGQLLVSHAARFAADRWQVAKTKPFFLEISADMLRYVPFAERAGMTYIGETEGNLSRVYKDMSYLLKNTARVRAGEILSEDTHGIVEKQLDRMRSSIELMKEEGLELDEFLDRLEGLKKNETLRDLKFFKEIVSLPKPTYLKGLNRRAEDFVKQRAGELSLNNGYEHSLPSIDQISGPISIDNLTISFVSNVRLTRKTHAIQLAFGISPNNIRATVIRELSLCVQPGEVVLVVGPSGSGKTSLLKYLSGNTRSSKALEVGGTISLPKNFRPGMLKETRSRKPLIEVFGSEDVMTTLDLMGRVGLSDAYVYLKRFGELSRGQQYRAMLARLILGRSNVWLIDDFCANLDSVTANVVSDKLQRTARELGVTVVAAAPHCESFVHSLSPDRVLTLTSAWEHHIHRAHDFLGSLPKESRSYSGIPLLRIDSSYLEWIKTGRKTSTLRKGRLRISPGLLLLEGGGEILAVTVEETSYRQFRTLDENVARSDGFSNLQALHSALHSFYPDIKDTTYFTVVKFRTFTTIP
jgi:ABC-type phosphate/phosphonate transport system ATPase subunit/GNAT superfamily N-acetyltransferase